MLSGWGALWALLLPIFPIFLGFRAGIAGVITRNFAWQAVFGNATAIFVLHELLAVAASLLLPAVLAMLLVAVFDIGELVAYD